MTENETKLEKMIAEDYKAVLHEAKSMGCNNIKALYHIPLKNMELIIKALEEVKQYREIGTPEELQTMKERGGFTGVELAQIAAGQMKLKEYEAVGTPEECLQNKDFLDFLAGKMNPGDFETYLHLYNALEEGE